jgi:hypothetical protein
MLNFSRVTILIALLASSAVAQRQMGGSIGFGRGNSSFTHFGGRHTIIAGGHEPRTHTPAYGYYGLPYFYSDYDQPYDSQYQPPAPAPPPAPQVKAEPLPDPVLLELRGNQWVRVTDFGTLSDQSVAAKKPPAQPLQVKSLPPAILVYRDGHTEEVSSYSIIGGSIYTKANYWSTGAWTRTIPIADLDIPATLSQNEKRGVKFEFPSGPDEVMLRP